MESMLARMRSREGATQQQRAAESQNGQEFGALERLRLARQQERMRTAMRNAMRSGPGVRHPPPGPGVRHPPSGPGARHPPTDLNLARVLWRDLVDELDD